MFRQNCTCSALLKDCAPVVPYGAITRCGPPFQTVPVTQRSATGLFRVRSPLLTESRLMSFPPATEMFQFAGFASPTYGFSRGSPSREGLPHSEIPGSTIARISPGLFAACHVLHRLLAPRHPPDALNLRLITARSPSIVAYRAITFDRRVPRDHLRSSRTARSPSIVAYRAITFDRRGPVAHRDKPRNQRSSRHATALAIARILVLFRRSRR